MKKTKLIATIMTICLAISTLAYGVYAATNLSFTIGANIAFEVQNLFVEVELDITGAYYDVGGTLYEVNFPAYSFTSPTGVETTNTLLSNEVTEWRAENVTFLGENTPQTTATVGNVLDAMKLNSNAQTPVVVNVIVTNMTPGKQIRCTLTPTLGNLSTYVNENIEVADVSDTLTMVANASGEAGNVATLRYSFESKDLTHAFAVNGVSFGIAIVEKTGTEITFVNGQTQNIQNATATWPTDPTPATGYIFDGWYDTSASTGGTKYTADSTITTDVTLYARFFEGYVINVTYELYSIYSYGNTQIYSSETLGGEKTLRETNNLLPDTNMEEDTTITYYIPKNSYISVEFIAQNNTYECALSLYSFSNIGGATKTVLEINGGGWETKIKIDYLAVDNFEIYIKFWTC